MIKCNIQGNEPAMSQRKELIEKIATLKVISVISYRFVFITSCKNQNFSLQAVFLIRRLLDDRIRNTTTKENIKSALSPKGRFLSGDLLLTKCTIKIFS